MEGSLSRLSQVKPGAHELRREVVVHHQRERILAALVDLVAERGYRGVSVAAIVKRAGTARLKFYENFSSKEDCFLVAYDDGVGEAVALVGAACEGAGERLADRAAAGISALLDFLAARPALARACILEAPSVGAATGDRRRRALAGFAPLLVGARGPDGGEGLPANLEESTLDGLYWLLYDAILTGKPQPLTELRPAMIEFALLPFLGAAAARAAAGRS